MSKSNIGENIRYYRKYRRMSQRELDKKAGIGQSYISAVETGKFSPNAKKLEAIAKALDTTVLSLIDGIGKPPITDRERLSPIVVYEKRLEMDLSQAQLAKLAGVSRYTVIKLESYTPMSQETEDKIKEVLGL